MISTGTMYFGLPDGAKLGYEIFGSEHLPKHTKLPLILIGGMSNTKIDWERLITPLSQTRTVMVYDHRGMGHSTYSTPARDDDISIEMMARDLLALIEYLGWNNVDILGFSMGGVVLQQLLLFPEHPSHPTSLPFRVHHALLTGTMCSVIRLELPPPQLSSPLRPGQPLTVEQKKELARPLLDASLGPQWISQRENRDRYALWLDRMIVGRPQRTIRKQLRATGRFDFRETLHKIAPSTKILVIHGEKDLIVPYSSGWKIVELIPHAQAVPRGSSKGQVPNYDFGHIWYEYFAVEVWKDVIEGFLDDEHVPPERARL